MCNWPLHCMVAPHVLPSKSLPMSSNMTHDRLPLAGSWQMAGRTMSSVTALKMCNLSAMIQSLMWHMMSHAAINSVSVVTTVLLLAKCSSVSREHNCTLAQSHRRWRPPRRTSRCHWLCWSVLFFYLVRPIPQGFVGCAS